MDDYMRRLWTRPNPILLAREDAQRYRRPDRSGYMAQADGFYRRGLRDLKYDSNQPRVPAGNPDGGRWTGGALATGVDNGADASEHRPARYLLAAAGKQSEAYCWNQLHIDELYCFSLRPMSWAMACKRQAMQRYAACISGKQIPPLPF